MKELNQIQKLCVNFKHHDFKYGTVYQCSYEDIVKIMIEHKLKADLVVTDPPYNVNAKAKDQAKKDSNEIKVSYNDNMDSDLYLKFISDFSYYIFEITNMLVISPGHSNIGTWLDIGLPDDYLFHNKPDGQGWSKNARANKTELYLVYGKTKSNKRYPTNTIKENINHHIRYCLHPHPKSPELYKKIIEPMEPTLVFDPFLGSGTTGVVCESLGIPWFGCEISDVYVDECIIPRCNKSKPEIVNNGMREI